MNIELNDLENILNKEIEAYSKLEEYILEKKDSLITGDVDKLKNIDFELEKYSLLAEKLETKRREISSKFNNENLTLSELIEKIESENVETTSVISLKDKLASLVGNIDKQNKINAELIKHSLRILEHSIVSITNVLVPESSAYNNMGKSRGNTVSERISSVVRDA